MDDWYDLAEIYSVLNNICLIHCLVRKTCEPDYRHLEEGGHIEGANTEADRSNKSLKERRAND